MNIAKKSLIIYSSRQATGNSEKLARAIASAIGMACEIHSAEDAPEPSEFAFVILAFGIYHGWPDGAMRAFMRRCRSQDVGIAITLGAYPDSEHAHICLGRAEGLMDSCKIKAKFICQGRVDPALIDRMKARPAGTPHSWGTERAERVGKAEKHPDAQDISMATEIFTDAWRKILDGVGKKPTGEKKKAILLAAFGTSSQRARLAYENIERVVAQAKPGVELRWAYSSRMVRAKLKEQALAVKSATGALNDLKLEGYSSIEVLPLYMTPGEEHHKLMRDIGAFKNSALGFDEIIIGKPLLCSELGLSSLCDAILSNVHVGRGQQDALVFMGHGNSDGRSDLLYMAAGAKLAELDSLAFLACVEGKPSFSLVESRLLTLGVKKAFLIPFMIVAGDHAINDMAGDNANSWKSILQADGIECQCVLKGLGECDDVVKAFLKSVG